MSQYHGKTYQPRQSFRENRSIFRSAATFLLRKIQSSSNRCAIGRRKRTEGKSVTACRWPYQHLTFLRRRPTLTVALIERNGENRTIRGHRGTRCRDIGQGRWRLSFRRVGTLWRVRCASTRRCCDPTKIILNRRIGRARSGCGTHQQFIDTTTTESRTVG